MLREGATGKLLPTALQADRLRETRPLLQHRNLHSKPEPETNSLYYRNVCREPIGLLRSALRKSPPLWALLGLSFIGASILEELTDVRLAPGLIETMRLLDIEHVKDLDLFAPAFSPSTAPEAYHEDV